MGKTGVFWSVILVLVAGCNRQDTDSLARIGRKIVDRSEETTRGLREKIHQGLPEMNASLQDRVQRRLRWDRALEGTAMEVKASGEEVEIKGTVKTPEQRRRAVDLVENTVGVERVLDSLKVESVEP